MLKPLYDHQAEDVQKLRQSFAAGNKRVIFQAPTGYGKTLVMSHIAAKVHAKGGVVLFVADKKKLLTQARQAFKWTGAELGILSGNQTTDNLDHCDIIISTIQTLTRRDFDLSRVTMIMVDECHIIYRGLKNIVADNPSIKILGVSATPVKHNLGKIYQDIVRSHSISWLQNKGYLARDIVYLPEGDSVTQSLNGCRLQNGDYASWDLYKRLSKHAVIKKLVSTYKLLANDKPCLVYAASVELSKQHTQDFINAGYRAAHVDGTTPDDERNSIYSDFERGKITILCSCDLLVYGADFPHVEAVILARPTRSIVTHIQSIGRGLRVTPTKTSCIIIDLVGNHLSLGRVADFEAGELTNERRAKRGGYKVIQAVNNCPKCSALMLKDIKNCKQCGHVRDEIEASKSFIDGRLISQNSADFQLTLEAYENRRECYLMLIGFAKSAHYPNPKGWAYHQYFAMHKQEPDYKWSFLEPKKPDEYIKNWAYLRAKNYQKRQLRRP